MSIQFRTTFFLGLSEIGRTDIVAQPKDADTDLGSPISIGIVELGSGEYGFSGTVPDGTIYVLFFRSGDTSVSDSVVVPFDPNFRYGVESSSPPSGDATSPYFTLQQFYNRWGEKNVRIASNKDNTTLTPNYDAIQDSFDYAASELTRAFMGGIYAVPLDFTPNGGVVPKTVSRWAMVIAYADLYDARGQDEKDKVWNKISTQLKAVYADMAMHRVGLVQMLATVATAADELGPMEGTAFEPITQTVCREPGEQPVYRLWWQL